MQAGSPLVPVSRVGRTRATSLGGIRPLVAGLAWLGIAAASTWLVFGTPLLGRLVAPEVAGTATPVVGAVAWALALTAPACCTILGVVRLAGAAQRVRAGRGTLPPVARRADQLPAGCVAIARIRLPDGRSIPDVVVGPHGVAFFEALPPRAAVRRTRDAWEVRFSNGSWRPIENPLRRAARDGGRLRRHLEAQERDFTVRVHAAVLGDCHEVAPVEGCAVVGLDDVPAWLAALPAQRGLSPDRLEHVRAILAALA